MDQIWTQIISTNYKNINVLKIYNEVFKDPLDPRNFSEFIYLMRSMSGKNGAEHAKDVF